VSGLDLARRKGLQELLGDVIGGPEFSTLLVYDVSRWGRFQDPDESAHYEFLCRSAGVAVRYCAEPFENDGSLASVLLKSLKRAMAAEYSRELSDKITYSKRGLGLLGYWPGGNPGLGLRRSVVLEGGGKGAPLAPGERNAIKGNRVVVVPGPAEEIAMVRRIFRLFVTTRTTPNALARRLNAEGACRRDGRPWTQVHVRRALSNELYVGTRILGRARVRLGKTERRPKEAWTRVPAAAQPIISQSVFREAQRRLVHRRSYTDEQMLDDPRTLMREGCNLSHNAIARDPRTASPGLYRMRFGSLPAAFRLVGYTQTPTQQQRTAQIENHRTGGLAPRPPAQTDDEVLAGLAALLEREGMLSLELIEITPGLPRVRNLLKRFGTIERAYKLAGHLPTPSQRRSLDRRVGPLRGGHAKKSEL
jgi:DNA invertase Pin-like site-specific DNA recombinase